MAAGTYNIVGDRAVEQGATWTRTITVKDDGVARDLTGYTIRMQVRQKPSSSSTYLDIDTVSGEIAITDATNGIFTITLSAAVTAALSPVQGYRYDLELEDGSGVVTRLLTGLFEVTKEVTR